MQTLTETTEINISYTQIFWVSCDKPMPGPFPFPIEEKALGSRLLGQRYMPRSDNADLDLNNSEYPAHPHQIILKYNQIIKSVIAWLPCVHTHVGRIPRESKTVKYR